MSYGWNNNLGKQPPKFETTSNFVIQTSISNIILQIDKNKIEPGYQ